jgi:hypothetical protein
VPSRWLLAAALLSSVSLGCASDLRRVADATALQVYQETRYERECVEVVGPATCTDWQKANDALKAETELCNTVRQIGHLPPIAKKRLKAAKKKAEGMP